MQAWGLLSRKIGALTPKKEQSWREKCGWDMIPHPLDNARSQDKTPGAQGIPAPWMQCPRAKPSL